MNESLKQKKKKKKKKNFFKVRTKMSQTSTYSV